MSQERKFTKTCVILGGTGFIGGHLAQKLVEDNARVILVDKEKPSWHDLSMFETIYADLRSIAEISRVSEMLSPFKIDEMYQLAADMGGVGYTTTHEVECLVENSRINANCLLLASQLKPKKYMLASSVCVYPDMKQTDKVIMEEQVYPAMPDLEYGWEKLFAERMVGVYQRKCPMIDFKIARFESTYGPYDNFIGERSKVIGAQCTKIAKAKDGDSIEVWGDGTAMRSFIYVKDLVEAMYCLMDSNVNTPVNLGVDETISINELVQTIIGISGKKLTIKNKLDGTEGVKARNFSHQKITDLEFIPQYELMEGLKETYEWVDQTINK